MAKKPKSDADQTTDQPTTDQTSPSEQTDQGLGQDTVTPAGQDTVETGQDTVETGEDTVETGEDDSEESPTHENAAGDRILPNPDLAEAAPDADQEVRDKIGCVNFEQAGEAYNKGKTVRRMAWLDGRCVDPNHNGAAYQPTDADKAAKDWVIG